MSSYHQPPPPRLGHTHSFDNLRLRKSRISRTRIFFAGLISALIVLIYHFPSSHPSSAKSYFSDHLGLQGLAGGGSGRSDTPKQFDDLVLRPADRGERVTLISVYGDGKAATYLPLFFQTAAQNAQSLDLLFVNVDQGGGCIDMSYLTNPQSPTYASNIKHLCVTEKENDELYRKFICSGWKEGCDRGANAKIMAHLEKIREEPKRNHDEIFNTFKPWRGLVYKEWLRTTWWAWADADQLIGNFDHLLPKDIMNNFDMVLTTGVAQGPKALFMCGQMTFFKNNEKMARMPFRYKALSSIEHFELLKPGDHGRGLDEGEYSDMYLNKLPEVDVLRIPDVQGMEPGFGDRRVILADGHILNAFREVSRADIQAWFNKINDDGARGYRVGDTITRHGSTIDVPIKHDEIWWCNGDAWNPINACPEWRPMYGLRNIMYRKGGRPEWKIRRDVRLHYIHDWMPAALEPKMFTHFLQMKREIQDFTLPNIIESGYEKERLANPDIGSDLLRHPGRKITVVEITRDWWATWTMTVGADPKEAPRGFDSYHPYREVFESSWEKYYKYHTFEHDEEWQQQPPAPVGMGSAHAYADVVPETAV